MATHEDMVIVKTGQTESAGIKMRRSEAEKYVAEHEGASIVGGYETKAIGEPKRKAKESDNA